MRNIVIEKPSGSAMLHQFGALVRTLRGLNAEQVNFDLSNLEWVCPAFILPLGVYIETTGSTYSNIPRKLRSYLNTICFPSGLKEPSSYYRAKTYIPMCLHTSTAPEVWDDITTAFQELVYKTLDAVPGTRDAIYYPIGELLINIVEHSKATIGGVLAQTYPMKSYIDICIADNGRGFKGAYKQERGFDFMDHDAIRTALGGKSTKQIDGRGFGLHTSKRMISEGLSGSVFICSGDSAFLSGEVFNNEKLINIKDFSWPGVIIMFRVPIPTGPIDASLYYE